MDDVLTIHRFHFAFTATFHYLFPQLTMGLALLIVILNTMALRTGDHHTIERPVSGAKSSASTLLWGGHRHSPGIQFGTNWAPCEGFATTRPPAMTKRCWCCSVSPPNLRPQQLGRARQFDSLRGGFDL